MILLPEIPIIRIEHEIKRKCEQNIGDALLNAPHPNVSQLRDYALFAYQLLFKVYKGH